MHILFQLSVAWVALWAVLGAWVSLKRACGYASREEHIGAWWKAPVTGVAVLLALPVLLVYTFWTSGGRRRRHGEPTGVVSFANVQPVGADFVSL